MKIAVAVCARPEAPTLGLCLAALRKQGARPTAFAISRGRGAAQARNEALASSTADVIAFVDDDVAVRQGWLEAVRTAWVSASDDLACIGGPISATFLGTRPRWLSDDLLGVLGVANAGTTFHGGNVSFRIEALRGIGGFWPARGRAELRDWFSEEHHAQRELAGAGWISAGEPAMAADRLIDPSRLRRRDLLQRRCRYGARSALIGDRRSGAEAVRILTRSAGGAAVAAIGRDPAVQLERAARAIENAGVLLAPLIAHRDLQPVESDTPFRHAVPVAQPISARVHRASGPIILVYHRVDCGEGNRVLPARFAAQMDVLRCMRTPVPLEQIADGEAPPDAIAVTFDDGYAATMRHVLPVLDAADIPATLFVTTGHVGQASSFWWDEVPRLLRSAGDVPLRLTIDGHTRSWARAAAAERHVLDWFQSRDPLAIAPAVVQLRRLAGGNGLAPAAERPVTSEELRLLAVSPLITVGAHTRSHVNLRFASSDRCRQELRGSRDDVAELLDAQPPAALAYPFGVPRADVDRSTMRAAADAGFRYAVVTAPGSVTARTDRFALPRLSPTAMGADAFAELLKQPVSRLSARAGGRFAPRPLRL